MSEYKAPEGFETCYTYGRNGNTPTPVVDAGRLKVGVRYFEFSFERGNKVPVLPLKETGKIYHTGWDVATYYAIDAENNCFADNAHGGTLSYVKQTYLICEAESESQKNELRKILGLEIPMPEWAQTALSQGWKPPEGWTHK